MFKHIHALLVATFLVFSSCARAASETLTEEPSGDAYNYVTHYRILINAPASDVWPILIDFKSWMYEFEQSTVSGTPGTPGHLVRLYEGQEFLTQTTAVERERMLSVVNLPLTFKGEFGTGMGIFTLHDVAGNTEVSLTMSRRYSRVNEGFDTSRATRQSDEFQNRTRAMWQDRFLTRLKELSDRGMNANG